jgi:hypothetical protein
MGYINGSNISFVVVMTKLGHTVHFFSPAFGFAWQRIFNRGWLCSQVP